MQLDPVKRSFFTPERQAAWMTFASMIRFLVKTKKIHK
jgi:hypothetical protein